MQKPVAVKLTNVSKGINIYKIRFCAMYSSKILTQGHSIGISWHKIRNNLIFMVYWGFVLVYQKPLNSNKFIYEINKPNQQNVMKKKY